MKFLVPAGLLLVLGAGGFALAGETRPKHPPGGLEERIRRIEQRVEDLFQLALKLSAREGDGPDAGELDRLREECGDLRKKNEALRRRIEDLEREAAGRPPAPPARAPSPAPPADAPRPEPCPMPDGKVVRADADRGAIYIDIGAEDGVREEQRFKVFAVLRGG
ncbi:MAG: hypothetical protein MUC63_06650, partial [Planctomycetes bacterium]|nr:hypothetical protein [Planctomycetota bacterium]